MKPLCLPVPRPVSIRTRHLHACAMLLSIVFFALLPTPPARAAATPALPGTSLYQLPGTLNAQDGHGFTLLERRGRPTLVSMFYNSCEFVCPMLIDTLQMIDQQLDGAERQRLGMLLITFDPARDDVRTLAAIAKTRALDPTRWTLARTDDASVRRIAAALDIRYRLMPGGVYNHSTTLVLLDGEGRIVGRSSKLGALDPAFVALVHRTLAAPARAGD